MNKKVLIGLILLVALLIYFLPLLMEFQRIDVSIWGICIGTGCVSYSASSTSGIGGIDCRGYGIGLICTSDVNKYCTYMHPFTSREKCICEAVTENEKYSKRFRKYCPKEGKCYDNSWEYEFGCADDIEKTCKEVEKELNTKPAFSTFCYSRGIFRGLISNESDCLQTYIYIYIKATDQEKRLAISEKGTIDWEGKSYIGLNNLCKLICQNCDTILCDKGNLCEYAKYPSNLSNNST